MHRDRPIHPSLVTLHWVMALLIILAVGAILGRAQLPSGHEWRPAMRNLHLVTGQLILGLVVLRLLLRLRHGLPPVNKAPVWARWGGWAVHGLLYAVMLAQPITGILFMQAGGKTVSFFGWNLPLLVAENNDLHFQLKEAHQVIGTAFYVLLGMHVSAALWHHLVRRNATLHRMLPWLPARSPKAPLIPHPDTGRDVSDANAGAWPDHSRAVSPSPLPTQPPTPSGRVRHIDSRSDNVSPTEARRQAVDAEP